MDSTDILLEQIKGNIKILKYNRPRRKNAIDVNMYQRMTKVLNETAKDENIFVTVLTGSGDYYSSGNDLTSSMTIDRGGFAVVLKEFINAFITFPKLLIAIVNGPAIGIAATTLPLCDLVFASENAFFHTPFSSLGITPEGCSSLTFPRLIGERKATEMLLFNHKMSAKEALDCGFVNYLFKPEEIQTKVWNKIEEVSKLPPKTLQASKKLMRGDVEELVKRNELEMDAMEKIWETGEYITVIQNFLNRKSKI